MPDHDGVALLRRQTKRRRVDIGVKRSVGTPAPVDYARAKASLFSTMNPNPQCPELSVECSGDSESKSNVLRKLLKRANSYEDAMMPFPGATIISQLLKGSMTSKNASADGAYQEPEVQQQEDACSSSSSRESPHNCLSPFGRATSSQLDPERLSDEHLRAKRARVENIIRGMSHSPSVASRAGEPLPPPLLPSSPRESYRENKRKQKLPQQTFQQLASARKELKHEERRQLRLQLEDMQKQLRQLQEKFYQIYDSTDSENDEEGNLSEDSARSERPGPPMEEDEDEDEEEDAGGCSDNEQSHLQPGDFLHRAGVVRAPPAEGKQLAETLKQELNTAVSQVVDTVVKVFAKPPRQLPPAFPALPLPQEGPNFHTANQRLQCFGEVIIPNPLDAFGSLQVSSSNDQTEALPLVVRKNPPEHQSSHHPQSMHPSSMGFSPPSFRHPFPLPLMGYPFQNPLINSAASYSGKDRSSPESLDLSRETTSLRTKMSTNHLNHHHHHHHHHPRRSCSPAHPGSTTESLSLSLIKSECGDLQDLSEISPYSGSAIQEGLSPNHLKKAKLMFFYTRYPSSNMLKMFFSDVKFNRCITSQLIKWFSNFREFYYIQMEKFARQAINDGVTGTEELSVSRDCELFRALNMHYNKANDFEVPERFLEVAQITLREFFNAIVAGKDVDPSWKKAIYKVICKLDSEVPEVFKSPNCLQELLHE